MSIPNNEPAVMVGVDVGKHHFEVAIEGSRRTRSWANTAAGIEGFMGWLAGPVAWIVLEATGGYERALRRCLQDSGFDVHVAHPVRVRAFATAHGVLAKTDSIDAHLLVRYGRAMAPFETCSGSLEQERLQALMRRRRQLVDQRKAELCRLDKGLDALAQACIQRHRVWLDEEIAIVKRDLEGLLTQYPQLAAQAALLESVRGIGRQSALTVLADLPELGQSNVKSLTGLVGLAPYAKDSSTLSKPRRIRGGRPTVRRVLYMAAISAIQHKPDMKTFYQRLRARGKPAKVALVAVMRKLLLTLHAIAIRQTPWTPENPAARA